MQGYALVPLAAFIIYILLLCVFISSKKDGLIRCFTIMLAFLVLWSGGSFLMRTEFLGLTDVWFQVSLAGIWIASVFMGIFLRMFARRKARIYEWVFSAAAVVVAVVNPFTNWFLSPPSVVALDDGRVQFVYGVYDVGTYVMYAIMACMFLSFLVIVYDCFRLRSLRKKQIVPLAIGTTAILLGNAAIVLPMFAGIPLDIMAGVIFAVCCFVSLYYSNLFSLTLAFSRGTYACLTGVISLLLSAFWVKPIHDAIASLPEPASSNSVLIVAVLAVVWVAVLYLFINHLCDRLFLKDHNSRNSGLESYHDTITRSLLVNEIGEQYTTQIHQDLRSVREVRLCVRMEDGSMRVVGSTNPLEVNSTLLGPNSAVTAWLMNHKEIMTPAAFSRSVEHRVMWEDERRVLSRIDIDYAFPLTDAGELLGAALISMKKDRSLSITEVEYLSSLNVVTSVSVRNSRLYEQVVKEAQTDDLTGLYNRKHFMRLLEEEYEANPAGIMSLMILNIDDFKLYNQLYGDRVGDKTLCDVAAILRSTVGENCSVARYGGKEFAVLMPGQESASARRLAENLRQQIYDLNKSGDSLEPLKILTVSIGICSIPFDARTVKQLVENAEMSVSHVKQHGKNGILVYSTGLVESSQGVEGIDHQAVYSSYASTIFALSAAIDAKDHYTFTHSDNVAYYASSLAKAHGLNEDVVEVVREAGLLHDIGKIGIPESILNKPDRLTGEEYEIMKKHPENAVAIIRHLPNLDYVIPAVLGHHERWDGKGYPRHLSGEDIPLTARILAIADCFDAITTKRCYQDPRSTEAALQIIQSGAGTQFDPELAELFVKCFEDGSIDIHEPGRNS